jgi:hypothetical protein
MKVSEWLAPGPGQGNHKSEIIGKKKIEVSGTGTSLKKLLVSKS